MHKFAFMLSYYSPAAYNIVRAQFENALPHPRTLIEWMRLSDINGEHGFNEETMERLNGFVTELKQSTGEQLICTLMFDEMYIKKQVYWDQSKFKYGGYPTFGNKNPNGDIAPSERNKYASKAANVNDGMKRITRASSIASTSRNLDIFPDKNLETDHETGAESEKKKKTKSPLATRAIVFMLSGLNKSFEFPVGYHFVNGLVSVAIVLPI